MSDMFKNVEKKTGVSMGSIKKLADSLKGKDIHNEKTARDLVRQVSRLAGKPVSKETEDKIVKMLVNNKGIDEKSISKMMKK
ncbi:stage VI sporulation protein F [Virgibacillus sp. DJP39]|uniref:stage VI sporulation protein F n=1 Tax=Virgibacillus sp. DJP39 TaxID=3409790 RepID=UPI003BB8063C